MRAGDSIHIDALRAARPAGERWHSRKARIPWFSPENSPCFGLHDGEKISDMQIPFEFRPFFIREDSGL